MIIIGTITSMILISTMPIINEFVILFKCGYNDDYAHDVCKCASLEAGAAAGDIHMHEMQYRTFNHMLREN